MVWQVEFLPAADKAFGKLDRQHQPHIQQFFEIRLQTTTMRAASAKPMSACSRRTGSTA
jgi:mRNA-degrading endonuclease RelE of RelBE toxin-antitoxin system